MALLGAKEPCCAFAAMQLLQGDETLEKALGLSKMQKTRIADIVRKTEKACKRDRETAVAAMRYGLIDNLLAGRFKKGCSPAEKRTACFDGLTLGGPFALVLFFAVMGALFYLAFGSVGTKLCVLLQSGMRVVSRLAETILLRAGVNPLLRELICEGILAGISGVLSFLPAVMLLLAGLSFLEDCGYMARVACFMDRPMGALGLSGRSFVPLLMGFGCSVPAVLATRTLPSARDRSMTVLLIPFLPCSAKLPVFAAVAVALFGARAGVVAAGLYLFGVVLGLLWALLFKNTAFLGEADPFVMELPPYRMPRASGVVKDTFKRGKAFVGRVFSAVLLTSVAVWVLGRFGAGFSIAESAQESLLAMAGQRAAGLFGPLGFGDWRAVAALVSGLAAKEAVIGTLSVLLQGQGIDALFSPAEALSFLTFVLLYMPCAASLSAMARELGSRWRAAVAMLTQTGVAWLGAWAVYRIAFFVG